MLFTRFLPTISCRAWMALALAAALSACGGGDGGSRALTGSAALAGICTPDGQKRFIRTYMDESYLWYDEIPTIDPVVSASASITDYFRALLVKTLDLNGEPKDQFSEVLTSAEADRLFGVRAASTAWAPLRADLLGATAPVSSSVPLSKTVTTANNRTVGYVLFNDHRPEAQDELITVLGTLKTAGIQDLVLDLRYNTGGYLYVAQTAASMVTGPQNTNKVFERLRYNNKRTIANASPGFLFTSVIPFQAPNNRYPVGTPLPQLNLPRVYVLSSSFTCSASESIINGLRGVDVEVIIVGSTTCGKPYGFSRVDNCGWAFLPIEFQGYNAKNFGDYISGFAPTNTCQVVDPLFEDPKNATEPLGSPTEPLLSAALTHIDTGSCTR